MTVKIDLNKNVLGPSTSDLGILQRICQMVVTVKQMSVKCWHPIITVLMNASSMTLISW